MAWPFPIEEGHVLAFTRATGEQAPAPGDVVPLTFAALTALHDPGHMRDMPPGGPPATGGETLLHAEQHFEYFAPLRVGAKTSVTERPGESWTKTSRRGEQLTFTELIKELRDDRGELVVRARTVLVSKASAGAVPDAPPP